MALTIRSLQNSLKKNTGSRTQKREDQDWIWQEEFGDGPKWELGSQGSGSSWDRDRGQSQGPVCWDLENHFWKETEFCTQFRNKQQWEYGGKDRSWNNVNLGPKWVWLLADVTFKETHLKQPKTIIKNFNLKHATQNRQKANSHTQFKMCIFSFPMEINFISFPLSSSPLFISHPQSFLCPFTLSRS